MEKTIISNVNCKACEALIDSFEQAIQLQFNVQTNKMEWICEFCWRDIAQDLESVCKHQKEPWVTSKEYIAANLLEALKFCPNTGDWHAELKYWCEQNKGTCQPNQFAHMQVNEATRCLEKQVLGLFTK